MIAFIVFLKKINAIIPNMNRIPNARKVGSTQFLLLAYKYMIAAKTKLMIAAFDWKRRIKTASPTNNGVSTLLLLPALINSTNPQMLRTHKNDPTFGFDVIIVKKIKILLFGKPYLGELKGQFMKVVFIC